MLSKYNAYVTIVNHGPVFAVDNYSRVANLRNVILVYFSYDTQLSSCMRIACSNFLNDRCLINYQCFYVVLLRLNLLHLSLGDML